LNNPFRYVDPTGYTWHSVVNFGNGTYYFPDTGDWQLNDGTAFYGSWFDSTSEAGTPNIDDVAIIFTPNYTGVGEDFNVEVDGLNIGVSSGFLNEFIDNSDYRDRRAPFRDVPLTEFEITAEKDDNKIEYYLSRGFRGEDYGYKAIGVVTNQTFIGQFANELLQGYAYQENGRFFNEMEMVNIQNDLMSGHKRMVESDRVGVIGQLAKAENTDYHHQVFPRYGLPKKTFGGTPFFGSKWESSITDFIFRWCPRCDDKSRFD